MGAGEGEGFVRLRLSGGRFESGSGLPVEAMQEVVAYAQLLQAIAREEFLNRNPRRKRVPKGFRNQLALRLTAIDAGSVVPVLERSPQATPDVDDQFTAARERLEGEIGKARLSGTVGLSPQLMPIFARFGQTLEPGERITLLSGGNASGPTYDSQIRRRVLLGYSNRYTQAATLVASIVDLNVAARTFKARLGNEETILGQFEDELFEPLKEALSPDPPLVTLECVVEYSASDRPLKIVSLHDVTLEDPDTDKDGMSGLLTPSDDLEGRLAELGALESGWLDGEGEPVSDRAVQGVRALLGGLAQPVRPRLYPTEDGGVRVEWTVGSRDLSMEVDADGRFYAHVLDLDARSQDETEGDAIDDAASFLRRWLS